MNPKELERLMTECQEAGRVPFYVQATAGTTVLGAYDPLSEITAVAKRFGAWVHVDGCWGASVCLSSKWKGLLESLSESSLLQLRPLGSRPVA